MRDHSLMAEAESFPDCLKITALVGDLAARLSALEGGDGAKTAAAPVKSDENGGDE